MKRIVILLVALAAATMASGQMQQGGLAFKSGEVLEFTVSYRAAMWPNTDMGTVKMTVSNDELNGQPTYKIEAYASVMGMFRWFFKMDDYYTSWMHRQTYKPLRADSELSEGGYRFSSTIKYDWSAMKASTRYWNHKTPEWEKKTLSLTPETMDGILLFYTLRSTDVSKYKPGEQRNLKLLLEDTVRNIKYTYYGPEMKDIPGRGKVSTLKFSCQLATSTGESFEDGSEFFLWVSNDKNKVPLFLESPIKVGSIRARLTSYKNLKHTGAGSVLK